LSALLILVVLGVGAYAATRSALLDVDAVEVEVEGGRVTVGEVLAAAGVSLGDPMVDVDTEVVDARVSALPWVREVLVDRVWPGTVRITVSER